MNLQKDIFLYVYAHIPKYPHAYLSNRQFYFHLRKWILECISFCNFKAYCSEAKHTNVQSTGGPQRPCGWWKNEMGLMVEGTAEFVQQS